jgi:thymidylate synthase (FAD)
MEVELIARPTFLIDPADTPAKPDQLQGPHAEQLTEYAGRVCYDSLGRGRNSEDYHQHILDVGHESVCEHPQFSFLISGVSRNLTHELVRHRVGVAISQRSTRYCDESESPVVHHPLAGMFFEAADRGESQLEIWHLESLVSDLNHDCLEFYKMCVGHFEKFLVSKGVPDLQARKQARAAASRYLPMGLETELVWSANIRTLRHVISTRGDQAADGEIRVLACKLLAIMQKECPSYFRDMAVGVALDGMPYVMPVEGANK